MAGSEMNRGEASALADLQMHWDEAYAIGLDGDIWTARFHGSADELRAHTSTELRDLIRADYAYRQRAGTAQRVRSVTVSDDDDDYACGGYGDDDDDVTGLRGERMST